MSYQYQSLPVVVFRFESKKNFENDFKNIYNLETGKNFELNKSYVFSNYRGEQGLSLLR